MTTTAPLAGAGDLFNLPDDHVVSREEAAALLTAAGVRMTTINLAQLHHRQQGPRAIPPDRRTRHTVRDLREWFEAKRSAREARQAS